MLRGFYLPLPPSGHVTALAHAHFCCWCGHGFVCEVPGFLFALECQTKCEDCRYQEIYA